MEATASRARRERKRFMSKSVRSGRKGLVRRNRRTGRIAAGSKGRGTRSPLERVSFVQSMDGTRRKLVVLHGDPVLRRRLTALERRGIDVEFVDGWTRVREAARSASPATLLLVDPYFPDATRPADVLRDLLRGFPSLVVLAAVPSDADLAQVCEIGRWGIADIVQLGTEDSELLLLRRIREVRARPLLGLLRGESPAPLPARARAILETAVEVALDGGYPRDMAERMRMDGSTLRRWCDSASLPPPRRLLLWMRTLLASMLLDDPGRSVLGVAHACGYNSDQALRRAIRRTLPLTPGELRDQGAFETVAGAFHQEVIESHHHKAVR
jgi:AraC-like DNA-binding protein